MGARPHRSSARFFGLAQLVDVAATAVEQFNSTWRAERRDEALHVAT